VFPTTGIQNCWVHKTANVLNKMPKGVQAEAKSMLHDIWMAETKAVAEKALDLFDETFRSKYDAAVTCLEKDRATLLTFYDFPAEWLHLRTTNPIESTCATVRLRANKTTADTFSRRVLPPAPRIPFNPMSHGSFDSKRASSWYSVRRQHLSQARHA